MPQAPTRFARRLTVFTILFAVWVVFSGHFDAMHLGLGLVCSALVAAISSDLLLPPRVQAHPAVVGRFVTFLPWLLWEVVLANLHVIRLIVQPGKIRSQVVRFRTSLRGDVAKVALGNSITLTPGTVTMDINGDEFVVHALSDTVADSLRSGAMERRVAEVFAQVVSRER